MRRMILFDHLGNELGEISPNDVIYCERYEQINGEHSLTIATTQVLEKGSRLIYEDGRSVWREYVVTGVDEEHAARSKVIGTYYCVWSVQPDLQGVTVSRMPGVQTPTTAALALDAVLSNQTRWQRGTVYNTRTGGASMYDMSAWKAAGVLLDNWHGELSTRLVVSTLTGITERYIDYYDQMGESTAKRRFDFGADLRSVKRVQDDAPFYCRISPRGKGEQTDAGGYGRKITIESVNGGNDWLEYAPMVDVAKLPDGNGGYQYPTLIIENSDCETPADLKTWAQSVLAETLTPKITYEIDAVQAAIEGVDIQGVSLGDHVQVVDRSFGADGLRLDARITAMTVDELNERKITVTLGNVTETIAAQFKDLSTSVATINNTLTVMSTAQYVDDLLERINTEINAIGGYTYIVPGNGILTFDVAVADPLNPVEASSVVEIKGGTIRIANSKDAQGQWEWKTVFTSGHIAADLVTAANITAGYVSADVITGGVLVVHDPVEDIDIFRADVTNHTTTIGGFTVNGNSLYGTGVKLTGSKVEFLENGSTTGKIWSNGSATTIDVEDEFALGTTFVDSNTGTSTYSRRMTYSKARDKFSFSAPIESTTFSNDCTIAGTSDGSNTLGIWKVYSRGFGCLNQTDFDQNVTGAFIGKVGAQFTDSSIMDTDFRYRNVRIRTGSIQVRYGTGIRMSLDESALTFSTSSVSSGSKKMLELSATDHRLQFFNGAIDYGFLTARVVTVGSVDYQALEIGAPGGIILSGGIRVGDYAAIGSGRPDVYRGKTGSFNYMTSSGTMSQVDVHDGIITAF